MLPIRRMLLATDAWAPQVNGVAHTYQQVVPILEELGVEVFVMHPGLFPSVPTFYPGVRLALPGRGRIADLIHRFRPDAIHIPAEGPIGIATKLYCDARRWPYSTSFHTKYADYMKAFVGLPLRVGWAILRWVHRRSGAILVATASLREELAARGFERLVAWSRGVDTGIFHPRPRSYPAEHRPIFMYVGRVSKEKNIRAFLDLELPGTKYVVGDGPILAELRAAYPGVVFTGMLRGEPLAEAYANADVFVFPSLTDTFGNVILEALASGTPVAAYPATGPRDILTEPGLGAISEDLREASLAALRDGDREACAAYARGRSWSKTAAVLLENLQPLPQRVRGAARRGEAAVGGDAVAGRASTG